jgi:hypothetical protein
MTNNTMNLGEPPRIIKEKVLAIRGQWIVKGRIVVYHNHIRRVELMLVEDKNLQAQEVGFSLDELQQLQIYSGIMIIFECTIMIKVSLDKTRGKINHFKTK